MYTSCILQNMAYRIQMIRRTHPHRLCIPDYRNSYNLLSILYTFSLLHDHTVLQDTLLGMTSYLKRGRVILTAESTLHIFLCSDKENIPLDTLRTLSKRPESNSPHIEYNHLTGCTPRSSVDREHTT